MMDWLIGLVPLYGSQLLALSTFLSCLALPIPASILMLTAGGFVASGDLSLASTAGFALSGAMAGDQLGYAVGRLRGESVMRKLGKRSNLIAKASKLLAEKGGIAVFLSRWFASALGPYVNIAAGASSQSWLVFTIWGFLGESVWVGLYVALGYVFAGNITAASNMASDLLGFTATGLLAVGLGYWLFTLLRSELKKHDRS